MSDLINHLTSIHKDVLKEIGNIGAGNAATAFAQFLNTRIHMTVPSVTIVPIEDVPELTGGVESRVISVLLRVTGESPGSILLVFSENSTLNLLEMITDYEIDINNLEEVEISAVMEIGNILSGSYLNAINQMTGLNLFQSVPAFAHDMAGAILSSSMLSIAENDYALLIETKFINGDEEIEGFFFYIPDPGSLEKILNSLGIETS